MYGHHLPLQIQFTTKKLPYHLISAEVAGMCGGGGREGVKLQARMPQIQSSITQNSAGFQE